MCKYDILPFYFKTKFIRKEISFKFLKCFHFVELFRYNNSTLMGMASSCHKTRAIVLIRVISLHHVIVGTFSLFIYSFAEFILSKFYDAHL